MSDLMTARIVRPEQSDDCMHTVIRWSAENELLESFSMASAFRFCFQSLYPLAILWIAHILKPLTFFFISHKMSQPTKAPPRQKTVPGFPPINCQSARLPTNYQRTTNEQLIDSRSGSGPRRLSGVGVSCTSFAWKLDRRCFRLWLPVGSLGGAAAARLGFPGDFAAVWGVESLSFFLGPRLKMIYEGM